MAPLDELLGIAAESYSAGVREMACRLSLSDAFMPASENLARTAQLSISRSALRDLVQREGRRVKRALGDNQYGPDWTAADCTDQTVITGADGVMVPVVTQEQKTKRRATETLKRQRQGRHSTARAGRPKSGSDGPYKEFKIVSFYDPDKSHKYAVGTSGNHDVLGRRMRHEATKIRLGQARRKYSVTDGADWIAKQYRIQLPMLDQNILDYYHLRDQVIVAGQDRLQLESNLWNRNIKPLLRDPTEWKENRPSGVLVSAINRRTGDAHKWPRAGVAKPKVFEDSVNSLGEEGFHDFDKAARSVDDSY